MIHPWVLQGFVTRSSPLGFGRFYITKDPTLGFSGLSPKGPSLSLDDFTSPRVSPLGLDDFSLPRVLHWVLQVFVTQGSLLGLGKFYVTKGFPLGFKQFFIQRVLHWVLQAFVTQGSLLVFTGFCQPRVPSWVWKNLRHQGSSLGFFRFVNQGSLLEFGRFYITKGLPLGCRQFFISKDPPLGFEGFCHPRVPPWFCKFL